MILIESFNEVEEDRTDIFREFAARQAARGVQLPPLHLAAEERRLYIRSTLREDHRFRIHNRPDGTQAKFDKLASSLFSFYRGTALLYYRDYAGTDEHLPIVFTLGDAHPENFGVMPNEHGMPFFSLNDFDEAYYAPFSYDVKRSAVGFYIAGLDHGLSKGHCRKVVAAFIEGYLNGLTELVHDEQHKRQQFRIDNSPKLIRNLLEKAQTSRQHFLAKRVDLEKGQFIASEKIVPYSKYIPKFQTIVNEYRAKNAIQQRMDPDEYFCVKDVAIKKGSGTASMGLDRYYVLIEGPTGDPCDDIILEMKQTRRSVLYGLVPNEEPAEDGKAERVTQSHNVHVVGGDPYYGHVEIDGVSFLVRERSPFKDKIKIDKLSKKEYRRYATICGRVLARAHARSDEVLGPHEDTAEKRILAAINPAIFCADIMRFTQVAVKRIQRDHAIFKEEHALGTFNFLHDPLGALTKEP